MNPILESGVNVFLHPGEYYFGHSDTRIHTTLGSCVALTFWHPLRQCGGMCHYMLPGAPNSGAPLNGRYGEDALKLMMGEITRFETCPSDYEVKLFGGANMYDLGPCGSAVAARNVVAAEALIKRYNLRVMARSLGGNGYRQLVFDLASGDVWVRQGEMPPNALRSCHSGGIV
ncbi:hypothetical protein JF541_04180 [Marinobacter hydrocarbonoclasticus]|uniref:hypothetical protein n=1 Tax=Marinobacter nauticus TaxID=2743 RepID=UPI001A8E1912|nr:hypothetical protein [Marinobacter nauticus]MBN8238329.1 hypothetical protein [Marinobacter nauticus]